DVGPRLEAAGRLDGARARELSGSLGEAFTASDVELDGASLRVARGHPSMKSGGARAEIDLRVADPVSVVEIDHGDAGSLSSDPHEVDLDAALVRHHLGLHPREGGDALELSHGATLGRELEDVALLVVRQRVERDAALVIREPVAVRQHAVVI